MRVTEAVARRARKVQPRKFESETFSVELRAEIETEDDAGLVVENLLRKADELLGAEEAAWRREEAMEAE